MILDLFLTALELGLISSLIVLALFLSYTMLNVCDLSTDGCYILGAAVGTVVAISGHPYLSLFAAMGAGVLSGLVTAFLQTKMGVDSLLAGIIVNTGLYSVNMLILGKSTVSLFKVETVFSKAGDLFKDTAFDKFSKIAVIAAFVILTVLFMSLFLKTRLGLAIRATGNNPDMVRSSSINPIMTTIVGLAVANAFTALAGCLFAQYNKSIDIKDGTGIVTVALASLLIGRVFAARGKIIFRAVGAVLGSVAFRLVYTIALRFDMPAYMLKLVSSVIVVIAISAPYLKSRYPVIKRIVVHKRGKNKNA